MKIISCIFAAFLLYLAVLPCNDREVCQDEVKTGYSISQAGDHEHNSAEQDLCSPFCICSCCAANIHLNHVSNIAFDNLIHNTPLATLYCEKFTSNKSNSIWQPPKIG